MRKSEVPPLTQRELQAEVLGPIFQVLSRRHGREEALDVIREAMADAANAAGHKAATGAPEGPSLEHFVQCMQALAMEGQALALEDLAVANGVLTYKVARCAYLERYLAMGLPRELGFAMSCARDGAFAEGYHPGLKMERPACIGRGDDYCQFRFTWT
jgi:predicted hydrocarbon binding protein